MPKPLERVLAVLCYLGAMRVPLVTLVLPEWAFTVPSGLFIAGFVWWYSRGRSPFLHHHAREGLKWALQANLIIVGLSLLGMALYALWFRTGLTLFNSLWHLSASAFRWSGVLVSALTLFTMAKAARGQTGDALTV